MAVAAAEAEVREASSALFVTVVLALGVIVGAGGVVVATTAVGPATSGVPVSVAGSGVDVSVAASSAAEVEVSPTESPDQLLWTSG